MINVLDAEARMTLAGNADFLEGAQTGADLDAVLALDGQSREAARKAVIALMEERGLVDKIEPHTHMVPHGDRSNVVIEPWLTDQWYVDAHTLAQPALAAVREGRTNFVPKNWEKTYFEWLENIQPWCVSRQLWWGHQIPAWYGPDGTVFVEETEEAAVAAALAHCVQAGIITDAEAQELAVDADKRANLITRDEDVLDTWFSSALWPFSTLGWPDETPELKRYYPTSVLITGFDIIFFWVARMMMMGLHFMDDVVPFKDVYIHALVRDEKGAKMSKSKGNVIDPLDLVEKYGADALRFTLAAMAAQGRDIKLATSRVEGYRNFATKLWNAARFAEMNGCGRDAGFDPRKVESTLARWILGETQKAGEEITEAILAYRFNEAAGAAYRFVWNIFCDWYLEFAKPVFTGVDEALKAETRATTAFVLDEILKLLHPFMPFLTEELWARTAEGGASPCQPAGAGAVVDARRAGSAACGRRDRLGDRPDRRDPLGPRRDERAGRRADPARAGRRERGDDGPGDGVERRACAARPAVGRLLRRRRARRLGAGRGARRDGGAAARRNHRHGGGGHAARQGARQGRRRHRQGRRQARQCRLHQAGAGRGDRGAARAPRKRAGPCREDPRGARPARQGGVAA